MNDPELIRLFAKYKVGNIQDVPEYTAYCAANLKTIGFPDARDKTEVAKKDIEKSLDSQPTGAAQIRQALSLLESHRSLDFDRYRALIDQGYRPAWTAEQQTYYEQAVRIVRSGRYFFLSFTDRGAETPGDLRVNRRYKYFIQSLIEQSSSSDRKKRNLLADAINIMMVDENLTGFYYKDRGASNTLVMQDLTEGCNSCLVFVQLVDNAMFDPPSDPNYCQFEYGEALRFISQIEHLKEERVLFVVTETNPADLPDPQRVHQPYRDWVEYILTKKAVYLPPAIDNDQPTIAEIRTRLSGLVSQVKAAKRNLLAWVPE